MREAKEENQDRKKADDTFRNLVFYVWSETKQLECDFRRVVIAGIGRHITEAEEKYLDDVIRATDILKKAMRKLKLEFQDEQN